MRNRKFVLLITTGALLAGGLSLGHASNVITAAGKAGESDSAGQQQPIGADHRVPFSHPAEMLEITAKSENKTTATDARVSDGQERSAGSMPESGFFTYPVMFPD